MNEVAIDDSQREMCAVLVMRTMLTDYCDDTGVSFNDVFFRFVTSPAYKMLFDYSTGLWMEGPDYLREVFEDVVNPASDFNFSKKDISRIKKSVQELKAGHGTVHDLIEIPD